MHRRAVHDGIEAAKEKSLDFYNMCSDAIVAWKADKPHDDFGLPDIFAKALGDAQEQVGKINCTGMQYNQQPSSLFGEGILLSVHSGPWPRFLRDT